MPESVTTALTTASPIGSIPSGTLQPAGSPALAVDSALVPPNKIKKPRPYRVKAPKDSKIYKAVLAIIALKAQGMKTNDIAEQLALSPHTVKVYLKRSIAKGWVNLHSFDDPEDRIEHVLKHKVVENLNTVLDEHDTVVEADGTETILARLSNRAVDVSIEVAKGTGLLKQHQVVKTDAQSSVGIALKVKVEMPPASTAPAIREGSIGGTPSFDAEIVDEKVGS